MKKIYLIICFGLFVFSGRAQSIVGKWQLVKYSNCLEGEILADTEEEEALVANMKSLNGPSAQVIQFKDNQSGEESARMLSESRTYNPKGFLYKLSGDALYILDKKSRTIIEGFTVEKLDADSLIISHATRACDIKVYVRVK